MLIHKPTRREFIRYSGMGAAAAGFIAGRRNAKGQNLSAITGDTHQAGAASIAYVGGNAEIANNTTRDVAYTATSGNLLFVFVSYDANGAGVDTTTTSVADGVNTYTKIGVQFGTAYIIGQMWYAKNITGGSLTITNTLGTALGQYVGVVEFSGCSTTAPLEQFGPGAAGTTSPQTDTFTAGTSSSVVVGGCGAFDSTAFTAGATPSGLTIPSGLTKGSAFLINGTVEYALAQGGATSCAIIHGSPGDGLIIGAAVFKI